jgi:chemotaxis protein CheX
MDPALAKPFIKATKDVLSAMASLEVVAGTPYIKKDNIASGDVSAVIGITGDKQRHLFHLL